MTALTIADEQRRIVKAVWDYPAGCDEEKQKFIYFAGLEELPEYEFTVRVRISEVDEFPDDPSEESDVHSVLQSVLDNSEADYGIECSVEKSYGY